MRLSEQWITRSLLFAAPIVLSSTIAASPSRAASFASSAASLTLKNFAWDGAVTNVNTATDAFTTAIAPDGVASATADATADATAVPPKLNQTSSAEVSGSGRNYLALAQGVSGTEIGFDTGCGCFRFDFKATLKSIVQLTNPIAGERASADSLVAFFVFDNRDLNNPVDFFQANLSTVNPFNIIRSSAAIQFNALPNLSETKEIAMINGYYARYFEPGTALTVRGITTSTAVATVPEPPMFAALVILPGLLWWKRRKMKALPQEAVNARDRQSD